MCQLVSCRKFFGSRTLYLSNYWQDFPSLRLVFLMILRIVFLARFLHDGVAAIVPYNQHIGTANGLPNFL